jgi:hypothetical protein
MVIVSAASRHETHSALDDAITAQSSYGVRGAG